MTGAERARKHRAKLKPPTPLGAEEPKDRIAELQAELADMRRQRDEAIAAGAYGPTKLLDPEDFKDWIAMVTARLETATSDERKEFIAEFVPCLSFTDLDRLFGAAYEKWGKDVLLVAMNAAPGDKP
jgi:hypothetical protein